MAKLPINQIICGDCLEVMKDWPDNCVDLILTDPPYGIGADKGIGGFGSSPHTANKYTDNWDIRPKKDLFDELLRISKTAIVFGGNYFADLLPASKHWIVWDKIGGIEFNNPFSDCELVWTNCKKKTVKKYICIQQGFVRQTKDKRCHPTQKPSELFAKILADYSIITDLVLDPFCGSGTTCVAAKMLGRNYIGIDIFKKYCEIAQQRVDSVYDGESFKSKDKNQKTIWE